MDILENDFKELVTILQKKSILKKRLDMKFKEKIEKSHNQVFSLIIWDATLKNVPKHTKYFLREIRSDAIRSLPLCLQGYNKASAHALRSIIENSLRLIYYNNKPKEYSKVKTRNKGNTSFKDLFTYSKNHEKIGTHVKNLKITDKLGTNYSDLSRYVHAITLEYMDLSIAIKQINFDIVFFNFYMKNLSSVTRNVNGLLSINFYQEYRRLKREYREIIDKSMGPSYKKYIMNEILN